MNTVIIIDDEINSTESARASAINLLRQESTLDVKCYHPTEFWDSALKKDLVSDPALFIIDFKLTGNSSGGDENYLLTGTSLIGIVRDMFPDVPIFLISAFFDTKHSSEIPDLFDRFISNDLFTKENYIVNEVKDIKILSECSANKTEIFNALCAPDACKEDVFSATPSSIRHEFTADAENFSNTKLSNVIKLYRWMHGALFAQPGLLYDSLYTATLLGIDEKYFLNEFLQSDAGNEFNNETQYNGIFKHSHTARWWKVSIYDFVLSRADSDSEISIDINKIAPKLFHIPEINWTKCAVCSKQFPETVASDCDEEDYRFPVHISCSKIDKRKKIAPFFEPTRVIDQ